MVVTIGSLFLLLEGLNEKFAPILSNFGFTFGQKANRALIRSLGTRGNPEEPKRIKMKRNQEKPNETKRRVRRALFKIKNTKLTV